jgi:hypothetical protein
MTMHLILRRAETFVRQDEAAHDDFDVLDGDRRVGRLYMLLGVEEQPWRWSLSTSITDTTGLRRRLSGKASSRAQALLELKRQYEQQIEGRTEESL